jgi:PPOX class probable F420-dependent enzyme
VNKTIMVWALVLLLLCGVTQVRMATAGEGGNVLSDEIKAALTSESYIYVATRRANGEWSTAAPIWFMYDGEAVYFTTEPKSHKARRIQRGSPVRISVGRKDGPIFEGTVLVIKDPATVDRMGDAYSQKYWIAKLGLFRPRSARVTSGKTIAVKVTPVAPKP